ncbi:MAG: TonB family protein [Gammaproteobacteria bacterium]|nr:TonB family protein [Gammaproteobacteria bacterium]
MRFILVAVSCFLLCFSQLSVSQEGSQKEAQEEAQISKEFTKTYRAYNAAYSQRNYARAAELARKALDLAVAELGQKHEKIPVLQINLAHVLIIIGDIEQAKPMLLEAKARMIKQLGADSPDLITIHEDHAKIHAAKQELDQARAELDTIINIITKASGARATGIANVLVQQAAIHIAQEDLDAGAAAYSEALAIYDENFGKDNVRSADVISLLGDVDLTRRDYQQAEQKYLEALRIYQANLLADDPIVLANHNRLAKLYVALRDDKFAEHADKVIRHTPDQDGPAVPLFVMQPRYPVFEDGVRPTGWALVEFTVTTDGKALNPTIVESKPGRLFDQVTLEVAPKWRFRPKVAEGQRVEQPNTRVRLVFVQDNIEVYFGELKL